MQGKTKELPGRPREFDHDAVLTKAMNVFWDLGYAKTTYAELEKATGVHRQSLVYAFGDKKALFNRVLSHYAETQVQAILKRLEAPRSPLENIRGVFAMWIENAHAETTAGCLFVNTLVEVCRFEPEVTKLIERSTQSLIAAFCKAFKAAQEQGEVTTKVDAADLAKQVLAISDGALLRAKALGDPLLAEAVFRSFMILISPL